MKIRVAKLLLLFIGVAALAMAGIWFLNWLNRPLPVSLDDPSAQLVRDVITRSHEIQHILFCDSEADIKLLEEVYIDAEDYALGETDELLITKYLGSQSAQQAGYLTRMKAYFLWSRSGDPYPSSSVDITSDSSIKIAPTEKPIRYCPDSFVQSEIRFKTIAVRDNKAIVQYSSPGMLNEAILIRVNDKWFIISTHVLMVNV
jgi:hypothetical protein